MVLYRIVIQKYRGRHFLLCRFAVNEIESAAYRAGRLSVVWFCTPSFGYKMRVGNTVLDHQNIKMLEDAMTNSKQNLVKSSKLGAVT